MKVGEYKSIEIGSVVKVTDRPEGRLPSISMGTVVDIEEVTDLFSEKYAIMETNTYLHVLCSGEVKVFDVEECHIEVIND